MDNDASKSILNPFFSEKTLSDKLTLLIMVKYRKMLFFNPFSSSLLLVYSLGLSDFVRIITTTRKKYLHEKSVA